jgi:hypothetical protein
MTREEQITHRRLQEIPVVLTRIAKSLERIEATLELFGQSVSHTNGDFDVAVLAAAIAALADAGFRATTQPA